MGFHAIQARPVFLNSRTHLAPRLSSFLDLSVFSPCDQHGMGSPCFSIVSAAGSRGGHDAQHLTSCFSELKSFTPPPMSPDISATPSASTNAEGLLLETTLTKLLRDQNHPQNHAVHASQPWRSKQTPANAHRQKRRNLVWRSLGWAVIFMCSCKLAAPQVHSAS